MSKDAIATEAETAEILTLPVRRRVARRDSRFNIQQFTNPRTGSNSWRVTGSKRDGERVRENFKDEEGAEARKIELETEYLRGHTETTIRATKMSAEQVQLAEVAFIKLGDDWQRILDAVDYWRTHGKRQVVSDSPKIEDAVDQYLRWLAACAMRDATKRHWRIRMKVFRNIVANVRVSDVTPEFIEGFLAKRNTSPAGKDTDRRAVSRFFSWCIERPRRWATSNPCREVKVEKGESAPPSVLSIAECERLLRSAETHKDGLLVPYVAVCLFAGLRPFEASRLSWGQVNLSDSEIRMEAGQVKTGRKTGRGRVVTINSTLAKWLKACNGREFYPKNWRKEFDSVKLAAGFGTPDENNEGRKHLKPWPDDVMRHTAISHFFRESGSYGRAAEQFGNSEAIIKTHYQGRVNSDDTRKFYALTPKTKASR